jgi:hypothetical protein
MPTSTLLDSRPWSYGPSSIRRTAGCGPACPVVWQGRRGDSPPYADFCLLLSDGAALARFTSARKLRSPTRPSIVLIICIIGLRTAQLELHSGEPVLHCALCLQPPNLAQGRDLLNSVPEDAAAEIKISRDERRADVRRGTARCGGTFQTVARRQVPTVRNRRTGGNAMAVQWAFGWETVHRTALDALALQRSARVGIGTQYNERDAG